MKNKKMKISGAHFATINEIKKEGLLQSKGCIYGKLDNQFIIDSSYKNLLLLAPTGAGKGVAFVIPNLLSWEESLIIHDIKLENFKLTSGYRQDILKQKILVWNPMSKDGFTNYYNPIDWISKDKNIMVDDIQTMIKFLLPKDDFLQAEARSLLVGIILYLVTKNKGSATFGEVLRMIRGNDLPCTLTNILDSEKDKLHYVAYMNMSSFLQKPDKERFNIISTASIALDLWSNPLIDKATSKSDFDIFTFTKKAQTLYVGVEPKDMEKLKPLFQMFYQQCAYAITSSENENKNKIGALMIFDEFTTLGKMDFISNMLPYTRGYKLKICIIAQNIDQLKYLYGEKDLDQIISNTIKIAYSSGRNTANLLSTMIGDEIIIDEEGNKLTRPLFLPQEIVDLTKEEEIILLLESKIIKCTKFMYYKDPTFEKRLMKEAKIK